jgi:hypothetical protein
VPTRPTCHQCVGHFLWHKYTIAIDQIDQSCCHSVFSVRRYALLDRKLSPPNIVSAANSGNLLWVVAREGRAET